ncbi:MAG: HEAT repeat domain-containing protein [Anaerolineae bacterium]|nr:MAG: HEAT repeat domain-containing protein [Anaerolineae bacterium]
MNWLAGNKNRRKVRQLLKIIQFDKPEKRKQAAQALLQMGAEAVEPLIEELGDRDATRRKLAAQALKRLGTIALPSLLSSLRNASPPIRREICAVLGNIGDRETTSALLQALRDEDETVRAAAASALATLGDPQAVTPLVAALSDPAPDVRIAAVTALARFRAPQTFVNMADLLEDAEARVRMAAAKALGETRHPAVVPYLVNALRDTGWWYEQEEPVQRLMGIIETFGVVALEPLMEVAHDKEPMTRRYAIRLLGKLKHPRALETFQMALYDTHYDVASAALEALTDFGEQAIPIFGEALSSPNDWIRQLAVTGLREIGSEQAVALLIEALDDPSASVQSEAVQALGQLRAAQALPALRALATGHSDREVARLARAAVARIEADLQTGFMPSQRQP